MLYTGTAEIERRVYGVRIYIYPNLAGDMILALPNGNVRRAYGKHAGVFMRRVIKAYKRSVQNTKRG